MPAGRPKAITKELEKTIAELFWLAFTDEQVALFTGINRSTIQRARAGNFCIAIKRAEIKREMIYRRKIWAGKEGWQGAAWSMERKYPGQFSRPEVQLQINTTHQTVNNTLIVTAEVAGVMANRVKAAEKKIDDLLRLKRGSNGNGNHLKAKELPPEAKE
jgi:hypothetical protein